MTALAVDGIAALRESVWNLLAAVESQQRSIDANAKSIAHLREMVELLRQKLCE